MVSGDLSGLLGSMMAESKRESSQVEVSMPLQVAGFGLLILFAGTFGGRWALLAAGLVLLFIGYVLSGVKISIGIPASAPAELGRGVLPDGGQ